MCPFRWQLSACSVFHDLCAHLHIYQVIGADGGYFFTFDEAFPLLNDGAYDGIRFGYPRRISDCFFQVVFDLSILVIMQVKPNIPLRFVGVPARDATHDILGKSPRGSTLLLRGALGRVRSGDLALSR